MTLIKFEPFKELENFNYSLHHLLNSFPDLDSEKDYSFYPKIDISEDEKNIYVEAEIPGIKKSDLKLSFRDNILTIEGEKKKYIDENKNYFRNERIFGSFTRSFSIPGEVNPDSISAKFEDGILNIVIEKVDEKKVSGRMIEVR